MPLTPEQRTLRARMAARTRWSKESPDHQLPKARAAADARFERQVDPDGTLSPEERKRRAEQARQAFYLNLAYKSSVARANRKKRDAR